MSDVIDTQTAPSPPPATGRSPLWTSAPGWGIAADLTPPEIVKSRQIRGVRRRIAAGLVAIVLGCGAGWALAAEENRDATADLAIASGLTRQLQEAALGYADVDAMQSRVRQIRGQVAEVMAGDVDLVALMDVLQTSLPGTMAITQQSISLSAPEESEATAGLDLTGADRIGTLTISGTGATLDDLSEYVDRLQAVPGIVDVVPLANTVTTEGGTGTQFSLTAGLTDALHSNRFATGG